MLSLLASRWVLVLALNSVLSLVFELFVAMDDSVVLLFGSMDNQELVGMVLELMLGSVFGLDVELAYRLVLWKALELAYTLVSLCSSQWVALLSCMVASLLLFSAPPDSKVVEQLLLQLALWMYTDREANLVWAVAVLLAIELLVECMLLLLGCLWWLWLLL